MPCDPKIEIVDATVEDLPAILELQKLCYRSEAELYDDFEIQPMRQDLESAASELSRGVVLKALVGERLVGSVRATVREGSCHVGKLFVSPDVQNLGIGRTLMGSIEGRFRECDRFALFTGFRSVKNLALYGKLGYVEIRRERINDKLTLVCLEKLNRKDAT